MNQHKLASVLVILVLVSVLLAYFGRPKPPVQELVTARQELPDLSEHLPGSTALADRVTKSYGLALILIRTPYAANNQIAIESLRTWAADHFQREPGFLHPIALESDAGPSRTVFDSLFYNLGAYLYYGVEDLIGNCLHSQIARFHETKAYNTFRSSYFDLFGMDADSALLLARYQSDRAKQAVDVILWGFVWAIAVSVGLTYVLSGSPGTKFNRLRIALSIEWLLLCFCYLIIAFSENLISMLVSSIVAGAVGLYLWKPIVISQQEPDGFRITAINIPSRWLAIALWVSCSLVAIQILTWIRVGTMSNLDPVTLLLSGMSGNFLYDPAQGKLTVMKVVGGIWLALSIWTAWQARRDAASARETEKALASLQGPFSP